MSMFYFDLIQSTEFYFINVAEMLKKSHILFLLCELGVAYSVDLFIFIMVEYKKDKI